MRSLLSSIQASIAAARSSRLLPLVAGLVLSGAAVVVGTMLLPSDTKYEGSSPALLARLATTNPRPTPEVDPLVPKTGKAIVADLDRMEVTLVSGGVVAARYPMLSRGRPGTFWETPAGSYIVKTKEPRHFSSIGEVWMPWSMQFYGNFFIHGWPTYPDGTPVAKGYSGGCIRMGTDDAKLVFDFADVGTPIIVRVAAPSGTATSTAYYVRSGDDALPETHAQALAVFDADTGAVLWNKNADTVLPMGSLVVWPTALVALETVNQYQTVSMSALVAGNPVFRSKGNAAPDALPLGSLVAPLLWNADPIAARAFAAVHGTKTFLAAEREKARAVGMVHTTFVAPAPDEGNTTTANDMSAFIQHMRESKRFLLDLSLVRDRSVTLESGQTKFRWENPNFWIASGDLAVRGGGIYRADVGGGNGIFVFEAPLSEFSRRPIGVVVLGSTDVEGDIATVRSFVEKRFVYTEGAPQGEVIAEQGESLPDAPVKEVQALSLRDRLLGALSRGLSFLK